MKVFISHSTADADLASRVRRELVASGFQVWDESSVLPGDNWGAQLAEALEQSDAMVILLTPNSLKSQNVTSEMSFALGNKNYKGRVIPVLAAPPDQLPREDVPWILARFRMVQLDRNDLDQQGLHEITQALKAAA